MPATIIMTTLYAIGVSAATISTLAPFIIFGSRLITSYVISRIFMRRNPTGNLVSDGSRVQLPPATNNKLPVSYGTAWLKPIITDAKISTDQRTMWYVLALCEVPDLSSGFGGGTISYGDIRWGDKKLNFDSTDLTKVISWTNDAGETDTRVNGKIYVYMYGDGSNTPLNTSSTAIQVLQDTAIASAQRWASTDVMTKTAFLIVKVIYDQEINLVGLEQITAEVINSLKDPGGVAYDYLTNERYGCAVPSAQVDTVALQNLSAYSAQLITYTPVGGGSATRNRFEINGTLDTAQDCFQNLQTIFDSCDSWLQWNEANATWSCVINKAYDQSAGTIPAVTLSQLFNIDDTNVIGSINLNPIDLNSTYNSVEVSYPDNAIYDQASYVYVNLDPEDKNPNEPDNVLLLSLPLINNAVQAGYIATRRLIQSREDLVVNVTLDYSGIQIDAGDLIRFNSTKFQWVDKVFRVTQVQEGKDEAGFLYVTLTLVEYNAGMYASNLNISDFIPSPNTGITDPNIAATPVAPTTGNIVNNTELPRFDVSVVLPVQGRYGSIELWYSDNADSSILSAYKLLTTLLPPDSNTFVSGATVSYTVTSLPAGPNYYFRTRIITVTGSQSDYSPASTAFNWQPVVSVPGSFALSFQWDPTTVVCLASADGGNTVTGQRANLELYLGTSLVPVWDKVTPATQPNNSWYANTVSGSTGLSVSSLTLDDVNDLAYFTITGLTVDQGLATVSDAWFKDSGGNLINLSTTSIFVNKVRNGSTGNTGLSQRIGYARFGNTIFTPTAGNITTAGNLTYPDAANSNTTWNMNVAWSDDPNNASNLTLYQTNGTYNSVTNVTTWTTPFLSSLRVGELSAITVNTGNLTVSGQIQSGNATRTGNTMTAGTSGSLFSSDGTFTMGNPTTNITFDGTAVTLNGPLATVAAGQKTTGSTQSFASASQWTGNTIPVVSLTTTGAPVKIMGTISIQYNIVDTSSTSYGASALFRVRLKMDGSYLANGEYVGQYATFVSQSGTNRHQTVPLVPVVYRHTPTAGAHTYQIELFVEHYDAAGAAYSNSGEMYGQYWFVAEENKI